MDKNRLLAKIDLDAIDHNIYEVSKRHPGRPLMYAVLKADGYGHGAVPIAKSLEDNELIYGYAVATTEEAFELKNAGMKKPVLILGYTFEHTYNRVIESDIRPTIFTREMAEGYAKCAKELGKTVKCHIKIDTGMNRIGYPVTAEAADEIAGIFTDKSLIPEGIFTHFARADEVDKSAAIRQYEAFTSMIEMLRERGVEFTVRHCSNSAASMELTDVELDALRLGIVMYGLWPSDEMKRDFDLRPALSLYSHIVYIKDVAAGEAISYGGTHVTDRPSRIATIPVGYADGYARSLSDKGEVLIRGKRAPICGRVCMDQMMVDVTDIPEAALLDRVTLIGSDGDESISLEELGLISDRFNYEFACDLGNRIPRIYEKGGMQVDKKQYYD